MQHQQRKHGGNVTHLFNDPRRQQRTFLQGLMHRQQQKLNHALIDLCFDMCDVIF